MAGRGLAKPGHPTRSACKAVRVAEKKQNNFTSLSPAMTAKSEGRVLIRQAHSSKANSTKDNDDTRFFRELLPGDKIRLHYVFIIV
jgi:hypothetical protein